MAEILTAHHTRKDVTSVTLASANSKTITLLLHPGETLALAGAKTDELVARDQTGVAKSSRPGPITADPTITLGRVRVYGVGDTTEAESGDIVTPEGVAATAPGGYIASDWTRVTGVASAGYHTFTATVTMADFGTQKGVVYTGICHIPTAPDIEIVDDGMFFSSIVLVFPAGYTKTRNA